MGMGMGGMGVGGMGQGSSRSVGGLGSSHTSCKSLSLPDDVGGMGGAGTGESSPMQQDPAEGLTQLPVYLRGGTDTTGFGDILGNALALLYVARQGLREGELWAMLSLLQFRAERDTTQAQETRAANHMVVRRVALALLTHKGPLSEMLRAEDVTSAFGGWTGGSS
ncbi:hypothetical protein B484DRAFT_13897 [Ochromonadaceae sp. CCMP2298]|nr:hypothetical protein B484DRAFT_13897 [Ochromonadaceae sp. CCMP2298]